MTLLQDLELAIGGDGTFDLDVYEAEAMRAMEVVEKWLRGKELNLDMSTDCGVAHTYIRAGQCHDLADELAAMRKA